ncbi:hypothetical protein PRIC1_007135 [Phytophthora ramorum]
MAHREAHTQNEYSGLEQHAAELEQKNAELEQQRRIERQAEAAQQRKSRKLYTKLMNRAAVAVVDRNSFEQRLLTVVQEKQEMEKQLALCELNLHTQNKILAEAWVMVQLQQSSWPEVSPRSGRPASSPATSGGRSSNSSDSEPVHAISRATADRIGGTSRARLELISDFRRKLAARW